MDVHILVLRLETNSRTETGTGRCLCWCWRPSWPGSRDPLYWWNIHDLTGRLQQSDFKFQQLNKKVLPLSPVHWSGGDHAAPAVPCFPVKVAPMHPQTQQHFLFIFCWHTISMTTHHSFVVLILFMKTTRTKSCPGTISSIIRIQDAGVMQFIFLLHAHYRHQDQSLVPPSRSSLPSCFVTH